MEALDQASPTRAAPDADPTGERALAQLLVLVRAAWRSGGRHTLLLLAVGIVAVVVAQRRAADQAQPLAGRLLRRDRAHGRCRPSCPARWSSPPIAGALLVLVVAQTWLQEMIKVRLREWLTRDLLDQWLAPQARLPAGLRRRDRRQPRPAHARGRAPPHRALGRPRRRPAPGLAPARQLRRRALGALGAASSSDPAPAPVHHPGLHGLVRARLRARAAPGSPGASAGR